MRNSAHDGAGPADDAVVLVVEAGVVDGGAVVSVCERSADDMPVLPMQPTVEDVAEEALVVREELLELDGLALRVVET